jgi:hypothetical protein
MPYASVLTRNGPPGAFAWSPVARPEPGTSQIRIWGYAAGVSPADPRSGAATRGRCSRRWRS